MSFRARVWKQLTYEKGLQEVSAEQTTSWLVFPLIYTEMPSTRTGRCHFALKKGAFFLMSKNFYHHFGLIFGS